MTGKAKLYAPATIALALGAGVATLSSRMTHKLVSLGEEEPRLPGEVRYADAGGWRVAYRVAPGPAGTRPAVFVHGWGWCGDATWVRVLPDVPGPWISVDLPAHGRSGIPPEDRFTIGLAADAVAAAVEHAGLESPIAVAHSMGAPVVLEAARRRPGWFSGLVAVASSAYWDSPSTSALVGMGPVLMAKRSPLLLSELLDLAEAIPQHASSFAWAWRRRPPMRVLFDAASSLRRFDARRWDGPPDVGRCVWVVAARDVVVPPRCQLESARWMGAEVESVDSGHSVPVHAPGAVVGSLLALRG